MSAELGGALGLAIYGSIGVAIYRSNLLVSADLPSEAAGAARATLGAAVATAEHLPSHLGFVLVDAAREAFIAGLQLTAGLSAFGSIGIPLLVLALLRHIGVQAEDPAEESQEELEGEAARPGAAANLKN
jgi:DHA2 family multidrug resistance protein-like MFS transporter